MALLVALVQLVVMIACARNWRRAAAGDEFRVTSG
jgi:hypothetical protein